MDFKDKTVLVTGAAGAIGKDIAAAFCKEGANVFITDLNQTLVDATIEEIFIKESKDRICQGLAADVTKIEQVREVILSAARTFGGKIDILINVAGVVGQGRIEDISEEEWDKMFEVNCKGTFFFIRETVPIMKINEYGRIINFSSKSGKTGSALMCHYSAAKAAIMGLTQSLACELADYGITVNCICPGITENTGVWSIVSREYTKNLNLPMNEVIRKFSEKVPLKRLAKIEDVVSVVLFLASSGADYMTGQAINITGGREMH